MNMDPCIGQDRKTLTFKASLKLHLAKGNFQIQWHPAIMNPAIMNTCYNEQHMNGMLIQMFDRPNTTPIGQDRKTLTFKALLFFKAGVS